MLLGVEISFSIHNFKEEKRARRGGSRERVAECSVVFRRRRMEHRHKTSSHRTSHRAEPYISTKKCKLPNCDRPRYFDQDSGCLHDYCGRTHAKAAEERVRSLGKCFTRLISFSSRESVENYNRLPKFVVFLVVLGQYILTLTPGSVMIFVVGATRRSLSKKATGRLGSGIFRSHKESVAYRGATNSFSSINNPSTQL